MELQNALLGALSMKDQLIPFWRESPRVWFTHFEAVIEPQHISDEQKYMCLLRQLQAQDLKHLTDLLKTPPQKGKYKALKDRLIAVYEATSIQKYQKFVSGLQLGDQKPTQLLRQMRDLAGDMLTEAGLKLEWLKKMPAQIRTALTVYSEKTLDELSTLADTMLEYESPAGAAISDVSATPNETLLQRIEELASEVAALCTSLKTSSTHQLARKQNRFYQRQYQNTNYNGKCWYHHTFGPQARQCSQPCKFNKTTKQGNFRRHQ